MLVAGAPRVSGCAGTAALAAGVVLAACVATIWATPGDAYWIADCGNKALVSKRLLDTGYRDASFDYPARRFDPEGRFFPIPVPFALPREGGFVSVFAPAYPALAAPALGWLGPRGLRVPAALGAAAAAGLFVLWSAPAVGRRWALAGSLVLALGSPVFFYGVTVWEHAPSLAVVLGAWVLLAREARPRWAAAGVLLGVGCWIRDDSGLMVGAVLAAAVLLRRPARLWLAFAAGVVPPVAALLVFNHGVYGNALGGHAALQPGAAAISAAVGGGATVSRLTPVPGLLGGFGTAPAERWAFGLLGVGLPVLGWLAARRRWLRPWLAPALACAGLMAWGVAGYRMLSAEIRIQALVLHNGLLLQWPMFALVGLGLHRAWAEGAYQTLRTGLLAGLLFILLMLVTGALLPINVGAHVGAGVHWGPRVLLPALPALALLAVAAARRVGAEGGRAGLAWAALAAAGILSTALATWFLTQQKLDGVRLTRQLRALEPGVIVTFHPYLAQHLAGLWYQKPTLLVQDWAGVEAAARGLRGGGVHRFLLVVLPNTSAPGIEGVACRRAATHRGRLRYHDLDALRCVVKPR